MATYCISDLHGRYDLYLKMLAKIGFSEQDTLYILGDVVDRGDEGMKIVLDIADRGNIIGIMGNHDYTSLVVLSNLEQGVSPERLDEMKSFIETWKCDGGRATYNEYKRLSPEERRLALMTIDGFRNYAFVNVNGREFVLCHAGINNYTQSKPLDDYKIYDFVFEREDYCKPKFAKNGKFLVTGHTPTAAISGAIEGKIFKNHDHIAIDCGAVFGYGLGCICLDTMEEFYVI